MFIDLSKAFNTISHNILLSKLDNLGLRGIAKSWFESYLTDRKQYMELYDNKSPLVNITCGVPQVSIMGPILFLIYVNDISNSTNIKILAYHHAPALPKLYSKMNQELEKN